MSRKFRHDDAAERPMPAPKRSAYADPFTLGEHVEPTRVAYEATHYRTTLAQSGHAAELDDRYFALGILPEHRECAHLVTVSPDRFGHASCDRCGVPLWCAHWVAAGLFNGVCNDTPDDTLAWAQAETNRMVGRMRSGLALV